MRRFLGIISMLLLFHLSLGAGDFACTSHAEHMASSSNSAQDHDEMQMGGVHAPARKNGQVPCGASHKPCAAPTAHDCCTAMASCAVAFLGRADARSHFSGRVTDDPLAELLTASAGLTRPSTPPPRA